MFTILVTGVGAIIGYGAVRSLRSCSLPVRVIGMDLSADAVGQAWCDQFVQSPPASRPDYPAFIADTVRRFNVDLVIPCIEQDVARFSADRRAFEKSGAAFALNRDAVIALSQDKWLTHNALADAGIPCIRTRIDGDFETLSAELGLPFLVKPRCGYASKNLARIETAWDLEYWRGKLQAEFMAQQIVGDDGSEYTVSAFGCGDGTCCNIIAFRRKLAREGSTVKATVETLPELNAMVERLSALFRPLGPTNFQFRRHQNAFLLLEINPRISSATSLRTVFGVNEAEMCIEFFLMGNRPRPRPIRQGWAIRYWEDMVHHAGDHR